MKLGILKHAAQYERKRDSLLAGEADQKKKVSEGEENKTVPGRQGQKPEYQEVGSGDRRLSG